MKTIQRTATLLLAIFAVIALASCGGTKEYYFEVNGQSAVLGEDAMPVFDALGKWKSYDESPSCAFEGMDRVYGYDAFDIQTYEESGTEKIAEIYIYDDSVQTPEGIAVGAGESELISVYGEGEKSGNYRSYPAKNGVLKFLISHDAVSAIIYQKK